jgi:hypothetical protein
VFHGAVMLPFNIIYSYTHEYYGSDVHIQPRQHALPKEKRAAQHQADISPFIYYIYVLLYKRNTTGGRKKNSPYKNVTKYPSKLEETLKKEKKRGQS